MNGFLCILYVAVLLCGCCFSSYVVYDCDLFAQDICNISLVRRNKQSAVVRCLGLMRFSLHLDFINFCAYLMVDLFWNECNAIRNGFVC